MREERQEQDPHAWIYGPHAEARRQQRDTSGSGLRDDAGDGGVPAHGRAVPGKCTLDALHTTFLPQLNPAPQRQRYAYKIGSILAFKPSA